MVHGDNVLILSERQVGMFIETQTSSGYQMCLVQRESGEESLYYSNNLIDMSIAYHAGDIWNMIENNIIPIGTILYNNKNSRLIYNGSTIKYFNGLRDNGWVDVSDYIPINSETYRIHAIINLE
jgi:hypothetical protein